MQILVVTGDVRDQQAARAQLAAHHVTVVDSYEAAIQRLQTAPQSYDVIMTELFAPATDTGLNDDRHGLVDRDMTFGVFVAIAASLYGVRGAVVFTDIDHHQHPCSRIVDALNPADEKCPSIFQINQCATIITNGRIWVNNFHRNDLATPLNGSAKKLVERDIVHIKNWARVLKYLLDAVPTLADLVTTQVADDTLTSNPSYS